MADSKDNGIIIGPAFTVLMVSTSAPTPSADEIQPNLSNDSHFADLTPSGSVVVVQAPISYAAAIGGHIGARMKIRGAKSVIVSGRVRDVHDLSQLELPVCPIRSWCGPPLRSDLRDASLNIFLVDLVHRHLDRGIWCRYDASGHQCPSIRMWDPHRTCMFHHKGEILVGVELMRGGLLSRAISCSVTLRKVSSLYLSKS